MRKKLKLGSWYGGFCLLSKWATTISVESNKIADK